MFVVFFVLFSLNIHSQDLNSVRLEVPSELDIESYNVEPLGEKGVLIFYESNELDNEKHRKWYFGLFNKKLHQQWLKFVGLENKMQFVESSFFNDKIHLLFRNIGRGRTENGYYEIVSLDLSSHKFEQISGTFPTKAEIVGFEVIGKMACMGINLKKGSTDLLFINLEDGGIIPIKLTESYESFIEAVYANQIDRNFYIALKVKYDNRYIKDVIHVFNPGGKSLQVIEILTDDNTKILRKFEFYAINRNEIAVFGIFDFQTGRIPDFSKLEDEDNPKSAGLFFMKLENNKSSNLKFIDFMRLDNIHGSISQGKVSRSKTNKNTVSESEVTKVVNTFYNINKPEIIYDNNSFIFNAEIYKPHYITETRMEYDYYGRPYPYTYNVFAGYLFFDVIVVSVTDEGKLIWNNDFILRDVKSFSLERHSMVFNDGKFVTAVYVNNGKIYSKTFEGSLDIDSDESAIATKHNKDRIVEDENNHIVKWFDNYFLIYGYQKINNRSLSKQNERTVFYINKIAYK